MYKCFFIEDFDESYSEDSTFETVYSDALNPISEKDYLSQEDFISDFDSFISEFSKMNTDSILDGEKIIKNYFPNVKADIFISHSHKDICNVKKFAKEIYKHTGLVSFIDSEVWNYVENLLIPLKKDIISAECAYLILNTALLNMIDRCECLFFLSTPNSFNAIDEIKNSTFSPWIYSELSMANRIEKKIPRRFLNTTKPVLSGRIRYFSNKYRTESVKVALKPKIENFIKCKYERIENWISNCKKENGIKNLNSLYESIGRYEDKKIRSMS